MALLSADNQDMRGTPPCAPPVLENRLHVLQYVFLSLLSLRTFGTTIHCKKPVASFAGLRTLVPSHAGTGSAPLPLTPSTEQFRLGLTCADPLIHKAPLPAHTAPREELVPQV